ncbi:hypothetical protein NDU88_006080 [Pleurodeles waltl]|uniref:Uncharacterized protein n=1 Tax=Pleurodeles waltl TaxID=8319 RepID=A0AAV7LN17_PLEWA|nr:hypothetical protein NDU88_006080 [Pleurodeles waltl]
MPLPSNDIEEFQNTNEDGTEDMWVAIVEEGICKGITRDEWNTEQNLDEVVYLGVGVSALVQALRSGNIQSVLHRCVLF